MYTLTWEGDKLKGRMRAAIGRAAIDMATDAARFAKELAPVLASHDPDDNPGTLRRSITIGRPLETHAEDELRANAGEDLLATRGDTLRGGQVVFDITGELGSVVEIDLGSWISYACAVEIRKPYIYPAVEMLRGAVSDSAMFRAWEESAYAYGPVGGIGGRTTL